MSDSNVAENYVFSSFNRELKTFVLKSVNDDSKTISIVCGIKLQGHSNGTEKSVNVDLPISDYVFCRVINPYLNAQNDLFKAKTKVADNDKTIGYIFPAPALVDDAEGDDDNFDEIKQAYKYYCIRNLIEGYNWKEPSKETINLSSLIYDGSSYVIIHKPIIDRQGIELNDLLPSLALYGYYNFPTKAKANVQNLRGYASDKTEFDQIVGANFLVLRKQRSLNLKSSKDILKTSDIIKLLYERLLVEADNPLYRFLILYQVIEYLIEKNFRIGLDSIIKEKDNLTNYKFIQQINNLHDTRSTINKLFQQGAFDGQEEIKIILKDFLLDFDNEYDKHATGDCFYDIRNLLFHDYRSLMQNKKEGNLAGLVVQCEILVHQLVISLG